MLMLQTPDIRQRLFRAQLPDGSILYLAFLNTGACALIRDNAIVETWEESESALPQALERFLALSHTTLDGDSFAGRPQDTHRPFG